MNPKRVVAVLLLFLVTSGVAVAADNKGTVLITGANRGIGLEMARQLVEKGYEVIGTARKPAEAKALRALGAQVEQLDVTDAASVSALAARLQDKPLDVLVNNAGISGHTAPSLRETDFDAVAFTFDVNSLGPMRVTQALLDNLEQGSRKTVVQITSAMGSIAGNNGGFYGYRASKAALNQFNKSLSLELAGKGFVCVVLHPGWVKTRMGGEAAPLQAEVSVAGLVKVIEELDASDNGRFYDYQGEEIPW